MNPNAKEFVPAHLMKRRQDETDELTEKVGQVGLSDSNSKSDQNTSSEGNSATTNNPEDKDQTKSKESNTDPDQSSEPQHPRSNNVKNTSNQHSNNQHNKTNGTRHDLGNADDRHLLKAGETYCEFNGEQFIIPGEDDGEYEPEQHQEYGKKACYDFGNAEDNEDEDVCNAYEQFLDDLPE